MQRIDFDELETGDGVTYYWQGQPFTGIAYGLRPDGAPWDEIEYVGGKREGITREWYPSGQIKEETSYYNGVCFGPDREWDEAGHLRREMIIEYGFRLRERTWNEAGHLTLNYEMGADHPNYNLLQTFRKTYDKRLTINKEEWLNR